VRVHSTTAQGLYSHAEGSSSLALGIASHAEGYLTTASGYASHAEGFNTVASGSYQHVQGQFNISSSDQSAFIIGNGTSNNLRSNLVFASGSQFQITGSLSVVPHTDEEKILELYNFTTITKQKNTSAAIKLAFDIGWGDDPEALNPGLFTYSNQPILPWDKKITNFYVYNNLSSSFANGFLLLPPLLNAPYTPGEIITVYNVSPSASANIKNSGSLKISNAFNAVVGVYITQGQYSPTKTANSVANSSTPILSGSWGNYKSINYNSGFSSSLEVPPGKKAIFEIFNWGSNNVGTGSNYPVYNNDYSGYGYSEGYTGIVYKLVSISDI
jgi:hypothetical protein